MGVSPVLFQSAGKISAHYLPGSFSRIDFTSSNSGGVSASNTAILGDSEGGKPNTLYVFAGVWEAQLVLKNGRLLDAVRHAFTPGGGYIPQYVGAMRVGSPTQAALELGNPWKIRLRSADYGITQNRIQLKIEPATKGKKITVKLDDFSLQGDNLSQDIFSIQYIGAATQAALSISGTGLTIAINSATPETITLDFSVYPKIADLAAYFSTRADFLFLVVPGQENETAGRLDAASGDCQQVAQKATLSLETQIRFLSSTGLFETIETNPAVPRTPLDDTQGWVNLKGAVNGSYNLTDFDASLSVLETKDVQFVGTPCEDEAVHILIKNHCEAMNAVMGKAERQFIVGGSWGESLDQVKTRAGHLASEAGALCYPGFLDRDAEGNLTHYSPAFYACKELGRQGALAINMPATRKQVAILGWEVELKNSELDELIKAGVWCGYRLRTGEFVNARSITTYAQSDLKRVEFSIMREALYAARDLREALERAVTGEPMTGALLGQIDMITAFRLGSYRELGIFTGDPAFWGYTRKVSGDAIIIDYEANLTAPNNFTFTTAHMHLAVSV